MSEKILKDVILPFIENGTQDKLFERFFFIRYYDEFSHLRIRFFNTAINKQLAVQKEFMGVLQPFLDNGLIDSVIIDTYSRELERYGEDLKYELAIYHFLEKYYSSQAAIELKKNKRPPDLQFR